MNTKSQIEQLRRLSSMPAFVNNPNTPVARAVSRMLRRKPTKSVNKRRPKTPSRNRLSVEKSKRNIRVKNKTRKNTTRVNTK